MSAAAAVPAQSNAVATEITSKRGFRLWGVMTALCAVSVMASLENRVVDTAGPVIVEDLNMEETYIWISDAFFLSRYVLLAYNSCHVCSQ
jgi:hypothetical protein